MNHAPATDSQQSEGFFRCPIASDHRQATIHVGRKKTKAEVQETSIDGFTVLVAPNYAAMLKISQRWVLHYEGAKIEVHPQWMFNSPDGHVQLGLRRLRDLTPPPKRKKSILSRYGGRQYDDPSYSAAAFGGFVLFLFTLMALPGLGDRLGTSTRIQTAFQWILAELNQTLNQFL
ncbi:hypothetical protein K227x_26720 [Rubripirellula lacrimiformis]|uniref:Uncharacterized protein n=1 Tax=Rubripirellula lacrimiformis TaxID=1930273 RepID=A0A517NAW7_9BACT|nr:hypothetical protein [Rubripirellula lacrimiformis]QDT04282.1 hypothetical protein K227x_26720 [Rubripirellula lacrimiformis]